MPQREPQRRRERFSVFLNIPYDSAFENLYLAYIAGLSAFGLIPRGRRSEEAEDVCREEFIAKWRMERLESNTVKTKQSGCRSEPEETVDGLRQGIDVFRRPLLESPQIVADL
jgi:hypothetical protein